MQRCRALERCVRVRRRCPSVRRRRVRPRETEGGGVRTSTETRGREQSRDRSTRHQRLNPLRANPSSRQHRHPQTFRPSHPPRELVFHANPRASHLRRLPRGFPSRLQRCDPDLPTRRLLCGRLCPRRGGLSDRGFLRRWFRRRGSGRRLGRHPLGDSNRPLR